METTYHIEGMTCDGCVETVEKSLIKFEDIDHVKVSLEKNEVSIISNRNLDIDNLQNLLPQKYTVNQSFEKNKHLQKEEKTKTDSVGCCWPVKVNILAAFLRSRSSHVPK